MPLEDEGDWDPAEILALVKVLDRNDPQPEPSWNDDDALPETRGNTAWMWRMEASLLVQPTYKIL